MARGEEVVITKHGKPVARLVSVAHADRSRVNEAFEKLKSLRKGTTRAENLTAYDATYLDLAVRRTLPLSTRDAALLEAARRIGVMVLV